MENVRAHLIISGYVQGVFFRAHTQEKAEMLGLKGWVRNNHDGTVEAIFEGEKGKVEEISFGNGHLRAYRLKKAA